MNDEKYIAFRCRDCGIVFIVPTDSERLASVLGRYWSCPLGHRRVERLNIYEGMRECMEQTFSRLI